MSKYGTFLLRRNKRPAVRVPILFRNKNAKCYLDIFLLIRISIFQNAEKNIFSQWQINSYRRIFYPTCSPHKMLNGDVWNEGII